MSGAERAKTRVMKREAVLEAAASEFNERGYHRTSVEDIAKRLNISKPTVYYYIGKKEDILLEVQRGVLEQMLRQIKANMSKHRTAEARLRWLINFWVKQVCSETGMAFVRVPEFELPEHLAHEVRTYKRNIQEIFIDTLRLGVTDGSLNISDPVLSTFLLAGSLNAVGTWYENGRGWTPTKIAKRLTEILLQGVADKQAPTAQAE